MSFGERARLARSKALPRALVGLLLAAGTACAHRAPSKPGAAGGGPAARHDAPPRPDLPPEIARLEQADAGRAEAPAPRPSPPPPPHAPHLRGLATPELPITWSPKLLGYLDFYRDDAKGRRIMSSWVQQLGAYRHVLEEALGRGRLPRDLLAVSVIESGLRPGAVSSKRAGGFWQFLPEVGRAYGLRVNHWMDERRDPERSSAAAVLYLRDLKVRFGTWELALAGFNAGHGAVMASIVRFNTNDFWRLCELEAGLPWETTEYVPKVLAVALVLRNLRAFGYDGVAQEPRWEYDVVTAPPGVRFAELGRRLRISEFDLERLNPAMVRRRTPLDGGPVALRVPKGRGPAVAELLRAAPPAAEASRAVLGPGETLARFARARRVPIAALRRLNEISDDADVAPGTTLLLPPSVAQGRRPLKR